MLNFSGYKHARKVGSIAPSGVQKPFFAIYKQIKMGYQISKCLTFGQFSVWKYDVPYCLTCISSPLCFTVSDFKIADCSLFHILKIWYPIIFSLYPWYHTEKFLYSRRSYGPHLSNKLCPSLLGCLWPDNLSKNCGAFFLWTPCIGNDNWESYVSLPPLIFHFDAIKQWNRLSFIFHNSTDKWKPLKII